MVNRSRRPGSREQILDRGHEYSEFGGFRKDTNFAVSLNLVSSANTKKKSVRAPFSEVLQVISVSM